MPMPTWVLPWVSVGGLCAEMDWVKQHGASCFGGKVIEGTCYMVLGFRLIYACPLASRRAMYGRINWMVASRAVEQTRGR